MRQIIVFLLFLLALNGCSSSASEDAAIEAVKSAETGIPGRTAIQLLTDFAVVSSTAGNKIEPKGWMAEKNTTGSYSVLFLVNENGEELRYQWIVQDGKVIPTNQLAAEITPQK